MAEADRSLEDAVTSGMRWSLASQVAGRLVTFATGAVLFRVLAPAEYGFYAYALGVLAIALTINDLGLDVSLLRQDRPKGAPAAATALATVVGLGTYAAAFLAAPFIASAAGRPAAGNVLRVLALVVLVDAVIVVPRAELLRAFRQRELAIGDLAGALTVGVVGAGLALAGAGVWAPAIGTLSGAVANGGLILFFARHRPVARWDGPAISDLLRVGLPIAAAAFVELVLLNVDTFIVARLLGADQLAFYALAFNVAGWPAAIVSQAVRRVSIGGFAAVAHDATRLAASTRQALWFLLVLVIPMSTAIAVLAQPLLEVVYGAKSAPAVPVLVWIAVLGAVRVVMSFLFDVLVGTGHQRYVLITQLAWVACAAPALVIGADRDGIRGAAIAHAAAAIVVALPLAVVGFRRVVGTGVSLRTGVPVVLATMAAALAGLGVLEVITVPIGGLAIGGVAMVVAYGAVLTVFGQHRRLLQVVRR